MLPWEFDDDEDLADDDPDEPPALGPCCICETAAQVRNIVMLHRRCAVAGHGWGCLICGIPPDGASAVLCDDCLERVIADGEAVLHFICAGYPSADGRIPYTPDGEPFDHDLSKHPEHIEESRPRC